MSVCMLFRLLPVPIPSLLVNEKKAKYKQKFRTPNVFYAAEYYAIRCMRFDIKFFAALSASKMCINFNREQYDDWVHYLIY